MESPKYGEKSQYDRKEYAPTPPLSEKYKKYIQNFTGKFFNGRDTYTTMLTAPIVIALRQSAPMTETMKRVKQLLNYCASHEDTIMTFQTSNMNLTGHSDVGYLNNPKSHRRAGGFFISNSFPLPPSNGAVLAISQIIKAFMSSAAEAELGALFINTREAVYTRKMLKD